jgi:hypothetical protein
MEQWVKEKFDVIDRMDISDEDKVRKIFHVMYPAFVAMIKSWGDSGIPTQEEFREMVRPKFAALGFSI